MKSLEISTYCDAKSNQTFEGRRLVFGSSNLGPRPPISCELYITNLPITLDVNFFYNWLNKCGPVYEMRLMMDPEKNETRGYGFVRFFEQLAALRAFELLPFLFVGGKRPSAQPSLCKRKLYVANIPKSLSVTDVRQEFYKIFPGLINCKCYASFHNNNNNNNEEGSLNRGFGFLEFIEHDNALAAKKYLRTKRVWDQFIKVDWAKPNEQTNAEILPNAFGYLRKNDYCAKLRLYAIANNYCIPIIVYGNNFLQYQIQYVGVLLKNPLTGHYCCIVVEVIGMSEIFDTHLIICEVATHLLECVCGLPEKNYILRVRNAATAKILFSFNEIEELHNFNLNENAFMSSTSVLALYASLNLLGQYQSETILSYYKMSFRSKSAVIERVARFCLIEGCLRSCFYSIYPKFRNNYPLNNNFNDTEIVLLLATATSNHTMHIPLSLFKEKLQSRLYDEGAFVIKSQRYNCHPNYKLEYVDIDQLVGCGFFHPAQKLNTPPLWVCGETYQATIFQSA